MGKRRPVGSEKNPLKKFMIQEDNFLRDLEWFVSDHAVTTRKRILNRRLKLKKLMEELD